MQAVNQLSHHFGMFLHITSLILLVGMVSCDGRSEKAIESWVERYIELLSIGASIDKILFVTTPSWDDYAGTLRLYTKANVGWDMDENLIPVVIGRNGLAWGRGVPVRDPHGMPFRDFPGPQKIEGDGKSPAGIFELRVGFGYHQDPPPGSHYPYRQATQHDYYVDDVTSSDYNRWISLADSTDTDPHHHWKSFERMKRDDDLYELGIVVGHNSAPVSKGKGSAIFLHIWRGPDQPTAGCTAMSRENMLRVIHWLGRSRHPLLIQLPEEELTITRFHLSRLQTK